MMKISARSTEPNANQFPAKIMKSKSKKQVGYLLSKGSPLSSTQQNRLKKELHSGAVKVKNGKKTK
jgi:hypothetical protein